MIHLSENKPSESEMKKGVVWIQNMVQAIDCINTKGLPTKIVLGTALGNDLFGEALPDCKDFLLLLKEKIANQEWRRPAQLHFAYESDQAKLLLSQVVKTI